MAAARWLTYLHGFRNSLRRIIDEVKIVGSLVAIFIFYRFDETPLKMTVCDVDLIHGLDELSDALRQRLLKYTPKRDSGIVKLLQFEVEVVLLAMAELEYCAFSWKPPVP